MTCSIRSWPSKDPQSNLPYWFDWTRWLAIEDRGEIDTFELAIDEGDAALVIGDSARGDGAYAGFIMLWLSGGTEGAEYVVRCRVTLGDGSIEDGSRRLTICSH
ncbi:MAG TPA: hypothetical protein VL494_13835 [Steroidobacteraceae bacterium]|jgi:hypothetical protein|nr:hypothetical protein [Steroidobacteraceae bacterium]